MKTKEVEKHLLKYLSNRQDFNILTTNLSWILPFEADVYHVNSNKEIVEYEIKISRGDFLKDKHKVKRTRFGVVNKYDYLLGNDSFDIKSLQDKRPHRFYYVTPSGLISKNEVPEGFGLINVLKSGQTVIIKRCKKLHNEDSVKTELILHIARNFCIKNCKK